MTATHDVCVDTIESAVADFAAGKPVVILDDPGRENEGDIIMAAQHATPETIGMFVRYGSGLICAPMTDARADALDLPSMVVRNQDTLRTHYTVTCDAATGVSTGISATDRARTLNLLADATSTPETFVRPGHIVPLRARDGGVLVRGGHTEASIDMCRLAGVTEVGVLVELVHDDGEMLRGPECRAFADRHDLKLITIEALREHLRQQPSHDTAPSHILPAYGNGISSSLTIGAVANLPTKHGEFTAHAFTDGDGTDHIALVTGDVTGSRPPLVRVHSECLTGDAFGSAKCDCGPQLDASLRAIAERGRGMVIYLRGHEGRGIGLASKIAAYTLQDEGFDTVDANTHLGLPEDARTYDTAADILRALGVDTVRLLTNNPAKVDGLTSAGIVVAERVPAIIEPTSRNANYLATKARRMGHMLDVAPNQ